MGGVPLSRGNYDIAMYQVCSTFFKSGPPSIFCRIHTINRYLSGHFYASNSHTALSLTLWSMVEGV